MEKVNKEAIRILVQDIGYQETAKRTGIAYGTLRQWANRGKWNVPIVHAQSVTTVTRSPGEAHADILAERKQQTKLNLSKYAVEASQVAADTNGMLKAARYVKDVAAVAGNVWPEEQREGSFSLNLLNLGSLQLSIGNPEQPSE